MCYPARRVEGSHFLGLSISSDPCLTPFERKQETFFFSIGKNLSPISLPPSLPSSSIHPSLPSCPLPHPLIIVSRSKGAKRRLESVCEGLGVVEGVRHV